MPDVVDCLRGGRVRRGQKPAPVHRLWLTVAVSAMAAVLSSPTDAAETSQGPTVYGRLMDPREHPEYARRAVKPPDWELFGHRTHLHCLREFRVKDGRIVDIAADLDKYTKTHELGDVLWPSYPFLFAENVGELADELRRRELFLFDIFGFVPGSGPGGFWRQFQPAAGTLQMLEAKLGPRWLGMDIGEQDGRYVGGYARQLCPVSADRVEQYFHFQRHFERMGDDLGNKLAVLVSLNFGHYFLKEGVYTMIGAETAQALPNSQVYYAFIRGAGKQYGVPWFGLASVFNRWGFKFYGPAGIGDGYPCGPTNGTSLSLLKRLLYSQILYNSMIVGFESGWFEGTKVPNPEEPASDNGKLSPIGQMQQAAGRWLKQHGQPGTMITPVAVMTDFFAGWSFPRHLYGNKVYRVWGNLPYQAGDYLTDGVLTMLYPGYQDSSYYHDESGFLTATPYGDGADCLLSDAPSWLLRQYGVVVIAGELAGGKEIRDKLLKYVRDGGHLVITAGNLPKLPGGLAGVEVAGAATVFNSGQTIAFAKGNETEPGRFSLLPLKMPVSARIATRCGKMPAVIEVAEGRGRVTVLASPFGVGVDAAVTGPITIQIDRRLPQPYPLLRHVTQVLDEAFRSQMLFDAGPGLHVITCRKSPGVYTVGVLNNQWKPVPLRLSSRCGPIELIRELPLDGSERGAVGQLPPGIEAAAIGASTEDTIAGGDVRIFEVRLKEERVREIAAERLPHRPNGRVLPLRKALSIKEEVLARPTFFEHFDGVMVDWRYLGIRNRETVECEAGWIKRQGLRVVVDMTSGLNLYPDIRLVDNSDADYPASWRTIEDIVAKTKALGGQDLVIAQHRLPENNMTADRARASMEATIRRICQRAAALGLTVHLRLYPGRTPANLDDARQTLARIGQAHLRLAPSVGTLLTSGATVGQLAGGLGDKIGLWMVGRAELDAGGQIWTVHKPLGDAEAWKPFLPWVNAMPTAPIVFDAIYDGQDAEYIDASIVNKNLERTSHH